jgi:hypothetical protein
MEDRTHSCECGPHFSRMQRSAPVTVCVCMFTCLERNTYNHYIDYYYDCALSDYVVCHYGEQLLHTRRTVTFMD